MKYAKEVLYLLANDPLKSYRLFQIRRRACPYVETKKAKDAQREAIRVILRLLRENGSIEYIPPKKEGSFGRYKWKVQIDSLPV